MTLYEGLTLAGLVSGPIAAVLVTLWVDGRRRSREQRLTLLRMLVSTRHLPSDPAFQAAINLIPIEFSRYSGVMQAYREFLEATDVRLNGVDDAQVLEKSKTKTVRLVFEIAQGLGFPLRETDVQTSGYASDGWVKRDALFLDSQKAMREVAEVLKLQTRVMLGERLDPGQTSLNENERN